MTILGTTLLHCCRQLNRTASLLSSPDAILRGCFSSNNKNISNALKASTLGPAFNWLQSANEFDCVRFYSTRSKGSAFEMGLPRVFFDMTADGQNLGRIVMEVSVISNWIYKSIYSNHSPCSTACVFFCLFVCLWQQGIS